ncbi:alpha/beta hydrolase [Bacillus pumilus]|uniref:alpha/beta hydrolase n=1 Tax=Bacillus pumilus TaxID=1408 RepID=UPI001E49BD95|nr:alpha/beta hydrolase [Bacillus pumilus]MCC9089858.1 alpha/beta hydrolase [Bacillus pumilus]UUD43231.1 alpha/beta hydrolase [Bacillus pumilus]
MNLEEQIKIAASLRQPTEGSLPSQSELKPVHPPEVNKMEYDIPTCAGETKVWVFKPVNTAKQPLSVFVNLHGGGFILGSAEMDNHWCPVIADRAQCIVVNVEYQLAPENPFPAALHECYDVVKWLYEHPDELQIDPNTLAIGGHSAGGNLATAVCLLNIQKGNKLPIVYQVLDYPPLDLATDPEQKPAFEEAIPAEMAKLFNTFYVQEEDARNPLISPVFADRSSLAQMPPALVITAEKDSLAEEAKQYADKLKEAGVDVTYQQFKGVPHAFTHAGGLEIAEQAWHLMSDQLKKAFE